jgi:hypothetical protein
MPRRTEYFRTYIKAKKRERRQRLVTMLGGKCVRCGTMEDLEFDHIDPQSKNFSICAHLTKAWNDLVAEAQLCQLLCHACHVAKGAEDRPEPKHGRYMYLYHRCRSKYAELATLLRASGRGLDDLDSTNRVAFQPYHPVPSISIDLG